MQDLEVPVHLFYFQLVESRKLYNFKMQEINSGVGAQGGDLKSVAENGLNSQCGLLVNSSRGIIYADRSEKFDIVAGQKAKEIQQQMSGLLNDFGLL